MGRVTDGVETMVDTATVTRWMRNCAATFSEQRDYLTQLDAAIGDADHGANMTRGFSAVEAKLDGLDGGTPARARSSCSPAPRWSRPSAAPAARSGARRCAGRQGARRRAAVRPRELVDGARCAPSRRSSSSAPPSAATRRWSTPCAPRSTRCAAAVEPARTLADGARGSPRGREDGMRATVPMLARKGRASYLGERSIGHQDPGATSTAFIIAALEQAVTAAP
jgi:dihydroxyacetone kinase-like protein